MSENPDTGRLAERSFTLGSLFIVVLFATFLVGNCADDAIVDRDMRSREFIACSERGGQWRNGTWLTTSYCYEDKK